ncbi:serine/threonine-protein phosphatase [Candidatus Uhrbacteria bacterium]|nr:serine/threonine-protein phosphatase [Candidatus Uhrbacteria bacterium]
MPAERPIDRWKPSPEPPKPNPFIIEKKESGLKLDIAGTSEGKEGRANNEDAYMFDASRGLLCVADGMGGTRNAGMASKAAIESLATDAVKATKVLKYQEIINSAPDKKLEDHDRVSVENRLKEYIYGVAGGRVRSQGGGGDTTISLAKLWTDNRGRRQLSVANLGDSRIYRFRKGRLDRLTRDQSLLENLMQEGLSDTDGKPIVDDKDVTRRFDLETVEKRAQKSGNFKSLSNFMKGEGMKNASIEEIRHFVTGGLQHGEMPDTSTYDTEPGDMVIAVSDGISDNLTDDEIAETLAQAGDAESASKMLRIRASMRSKDGTHPRSKPDDITAVVMKIN